MRKQIMALAGVLIFSTGAMAQSGGTYPPEPIESAYEASVYCQVYAYPESAYAGCMCNTLHSMANTGDAIAAWYYEPPTNMYFYYQWSAYADGVRDIANNWCQQA